MSQGTSNLERPAGISRHRAPRSGEDYRQVRVARESLKRQRQQARREAASARLEALAAHQAEQAE